MIVHGCGNTNYDDITTPVKDEWEVELDIVNDCGKAPESIVVWIMPEAKMKIDALMARYPRIEWLAYLLGDAENNIIKDIWVPKQRVTATSVDQIRCPEFNRLNTIGVMHSHHGMGNGFSGTDHEWINQNHDISLCIANSGIAGQVRWKTPCGSMKIVPCTVKLKFDIDFDAATFIDMAENNINKPTPVNRQVPTNIPDPFPGAVTANHTVEDDEKTLMDELSELDEEKCGECVHFLENNAPEGSPCTKNWPNITMDTVACVDFDPGEPEPKCGECIAYKETTPGLGKCVSSETCFNDVAEDEAVCITFVNRNVEDETDMITEDDLNDDNWKA